MWIVYVIGYIGLAVVASGLLRRNAQNDYSSIFHGHDVTDYMFSGFIGLFWPIAIVPAFIGWVSSKPWKK